MRRCQGTGVAVLAVEAIAIGPGDGIAGREPVMETAAALGARYLNVICDDPDTGRFTDLFAALTSMAGPYGVLPVIEFTAWRPIRTLPTAIAIARQSDGGRLLLDTLHISRCGVTAAELAAVNPALLSYLQICDAPLEPPRGLLALAPRDQRPTGAVTGEMTRWPRRGHCGCCQEMASFRWPRYSRPSRPTCRCRWRRRPWPRAANCPPRGSPPRPGAPSNRSCGDLAAVSRRAARDRRAASNAVSAPCSGGPAASLPRRARGCPPTCSARTGPGPAAGRSRARRR